MTRMMKRALINFVFRLVVFIFIFVLYLTNKEMLFSFMTHEFTFGIVEYGISPLHVLWFVFMVMMLQHIFPHKDLSMAYKKGKLEEYEPVENYSRLELLEFVQDMNVKAWLVMLAWLTFNAVFAALYLFKFIDVADMLMLTVFFYLSDYLCIMFFCPFQTFILKNRCCINCRIYDWGHFMMFTPMLFVKNFFSWSLFFTSLIVLIRWEVNYAKHPELFWHGSNKRLQCTQCKEKLCVIKNGLKK
ncbi:hypothetical protein SAMN02910298_00916 [Pseudobutyrivibrio sp. YE44]|uniref:hypothetical protein n=1 Tax=Pseudobutyrivibrio sp. YE44 TaxID=1520802 RepID=UPI00088D7EB6|nr:hypothetical protein [Pseudobutyrivibrio sp. YE44]SDB19820.1 hypothetical protein SAMN02910298_00916 [Pseudobutyrivibrio sp. YE44]